MILQTHLVHTLCLTMYAPRRGATIRFCVYLIGLMILFSLGEGMAAAYRQGVYVI
jgi:hypothetical protein